MGLIRGVAVGRVRGQIRVSVYWVRVSFRLDLGLRPAGIGVVFGFQLIGLGKSRFCGKWARKVCLGLGCLGLFREASLGSDISDQPKKTQMS